jgi:hypothetical protein
METPDVPSEKEIPISASSSSRKSDVYTFLRFLRTSP